jgi:hypothetical protein
MTRDRMFAGASVRSRDYKLALVSLIATVVLSTGAGAQDSVAFPHTRHATVPCMTCHVTTGSGARLRVVAPEGCRACHHGAEQKSQCTACHSKTPATRTVSVAFRAATRPVPVTRPLDFEHQRHATLQCTQCHANDVMRAPQVTCTSCHADHHAPERNCTTCHPAARAGHDRTAHDGCTTCHVARAIPAITSSPTLCLSCHEAQRDHNSGGDCATCHAIASHGVSPRQPTRRQ